MTQKYPLPPILRNLDNFTPGAFYSSSPTIRHERVISLIENWKKNLDNNKILGAVCMDLSKAFDTS